MKAYPVTVLCQVIRVSRSGFYQYLIRMDTEVAENSVEAALVNRIKAIFEEHRGKYGVRRILKQLHRENYQIGIYKVRRIMRGLGLEVNATKRYKATTDSRHSFPVAPNVLNREFQVNEPNHFWTADITYIWTNEGWMYLAIVMDLFSRRIVGWSMGSCTKAQLVIDALTMAYWMRKPAPGLVHHSDRGSQYACGEHQNRLKSFGMIPSMSRKVFWFKAPLLNPPHPELSLQRVSINARFGQRQERGLIATD